MADNPLPRYFFGVPPREYDPNYMREIVRAFSLFQEQLTNPGKVTANELNLLPEGGGIRQFSNNAEAYAAGLQPGDFWMLSTGEVRITIDPNVNVPVNMEFFRSGIGQVGDVITFDSTAEIDKPIFFSGKGQVGVVTVTVVHPVTSVGMTSAFGSVLVPGVVSTVSPTSASATGGTPEVFIISDNNGLANAPAATSAVGSVTISADSSDNNASNFRLDTAVGSVSQATLYGVTAPAIVSGVGSAYAYIAGSADVDAGPVTNSGASALSGSPAISGKAIFGSLLTQGNIIANGAVGSPIISISDITGNSASASVGLVTVNIT